MRCAVFPCRLDIVTTSLASFALAAPNSFPPALVPSAVTCSLFFASMAPPSHRFFGVSCWDPHFSANFFTSESYISHEIFRPVKV
jgi:hypothetical protein